MCVMCCHCTYPQRSLLAGRFSSNIKVLTSTISHEETAIIGSFYEYLTVHSEDHQTSIACMKRTCEIEIVLSLKMSHTVAHTHSIVNTDIKDFEKR